MEAALKVIGHVDIQQRFSADIPFNLLLVGPPGVGKHRLALSIAQQFSNSYDIMILEPSKGAPVSIGQVREAGKFISTHPFGSRYKIVIIDATGIADSSVQALLRMLEEPPERVRFIITTSGQLPLTIFSRCAKVQVSPLSDAEVLQILELLGFSGDLAAIAARLSKGSVETALAHINNSERRRKVLSVLQLILERKLGAVIPSVRKWSESDIVEVTKWFEDLLLAPYGVMSSYTHAELALGKSFTPEEANTYIRLLKTPMKASLKMTYFAIRILENS